MVVNSGQHPFVALLAAWQALLQDWSASGQLSSAAQNALRLNGMPDQLKTLVSRWSAGDFSDLPPIALLSASDISGAMGAYATSTGSIYLNQDWLRTATTAQVNAVLTEELGHHLDSLLNQADTPGDEGELFSARLNTAAAYSPQLLKEEQQSDTLHIRLENTDILAEASAADTLPPVITSFSIGSTRLDPSQPGGAYLSAALQFSDNLSGFSSGDLEFRSTTSGQSYWLGLDPSNLKGSKLTGTLYAAKRLDPFTAAGTWELSHIGLSDAAGNRFSKSSGDVGWNAFLSSAGINQTSFQVAYGSNPAPGTGPDTRPPVITGLSLDSLILDPSQPGGAFLSGRLNFTDDVSGLDHIYLNFRSDTGQTTSAYISPNNIISGSEVGGTAFFSSPLNGNAAAGTWRLSSVDISDKANNYLSRYSGNADWNTFLSSSGITQTSFQVAYGTPNTPAIPVITLAISSTSVTEDGASNLTYTFTRSGATSSALAVNYTIGGSALSVGSGSDPADYTAIATGGSTTSVRFAAGSAIASVVVDPTADSTQELDETVELTLAPGADYSIATTATITGTISNDDLVGTPGDDIITGTAISEFLDGKGGHDTMTGGSGPDIYGFAFGQSPITAPDRIIGFEYRKDKFDLFTPGGSALAVPASLSRATNNNKAGSLSALATAAFTDCNGSLRGKQALGANSAVLITTRNPGISGTYLLINDNSAGLSYANDLMINISGSTGGLPIPGSIPIPRMFG